MSLCRCIILAIVLCSKHSTALQYSTLLVHFWNQCKKLIRMGYHGNQRSCPEVGPLSLYYKLMIFRGGPPYLFTMSWWFPELVPLLQYKLVIFRGVPLYLCTKCFSEVGLLIFVVKHSLIQSLKGESHNIRMHVWGISKIWLDV